MVGPFFPTESTVASSANVNAMPKSLEEKIVENQLVPTLAPMLLAIGTFSFVLMQQVQNPRNTWADELFMIVGLASLISAAVIIDSALDEKQLGFHKRVALMQRGYLIFTFVVGVMVSTILWLHAANSHTYLKTGWHLVFVIYIVPGALTSYYLMSLAHNKLIGIFIFIFTFVSIFVH
jgi:hypothetical protein